LKANYYKYQLIFKRPAGTSRGILRTKDTYILTIEHQGKKAYGECALFRGLSADDQPDYEERLDWLTQNIHLPQETILQELKDYSSIIFGYEQALLSLKAKNPFILFDNDFSSETASIPINGLVWMGEKGFMLQQIKEKIAQGFSVIKLKIGAIDFQDELDLLKFIRKQFPANEIEIRVDANGAFSPQNALEKLKKLSDYNIHSIEQPIKAKQFETMAKLCDLSPIPIALDEELIGYNHAVDKKAILTQINPQYIILKPALHGGFIGTQSWINTAKELNIGWWITSALESNIGLNAIAQFTYNLNITVPQGLGTGSLFTNNFDSPLFVADGALHYDADKEFVL
jgi:o-succinylbenzoate synthase